LLEVVVNDVCTLIFDRHIATSQSSIKHRIFCTEGSRSTNWVKGGLYRDYFSKWETL